MPLEDEFLKDEDEDDEEFRARLMKTKKEHFDRIDIDTNTGKRYEKINELMQVVAEDAPFKLHEEEYMKQLFKDSSNDRFKVRVYLVSAQNLSAMNSVIDLKSKLAGMTALCTANPYPVIKVGDGVNNIQRRLIKQVNDRDKAMEGELNPNFLCIYELDAEFPIDNKLEVAIFDRGKAQYMDKLIGKTQIDLEARRHSDLLMINKISLKQTLDDINNKLKTHKDKKDCLLFNRDYCKQVERKLKDIEQVFPPVEFRELYHPQKKQCQGIIELWTEIFPEDQARKMPFSKIKTETSQVYEIRVVIWETRDVPLVDGGKVDIFIKCTFDPTGWVEDEVTKETDTHRNSKDGHGQFNWRMKFHLKTPCEFPRLKFQVMDAGVMSSEAIGETVLSLKSTLKKLKKQESVSVPKSYVTFTNPVMPDDEKGMMMFSMDILTVEDANQDPVGEAQNEPNKNPYLKRPTAGRGLGDAIAALGISVPNVSFNPFGAYLYFVVAAFALLTLLTFSVMLK